MERSRSMLVVIRSITVVIYSSSDSPVISLIMFMFKITSISSFMDFFRFSQYSRRIEVKVRPNCCCASSHRSWRYELITGTCGVKLTRSDLGIDLVRSHLLR